MLRVYKEMDNTFKIPNENVNVTPWRISLLLPYDIHIYIIFFFLPHLCVKKQEKEKAHRCSTDMNRG